LCIEYTTEIGRICLGQNTNESCRQRKHTKSKRKIYW